MLTVQANESALTPLSNKFKEGIDEWCKKEVHSHHIYDLFESVDSWSRMPRLQKRSSGLAWVL